MHLKEVYKILNLELISFIEQAEKIKQKELEEKSNIEIGIVNRKSTKKTLTQAIEEAENAKKNNIGKEPGE